MLATQINGSLFYTLLLIPKEENVAIYRRIEGFQHDISWRNIDPAIFRDLSREIGDFSPIYRVVNACQRKSNPLQYPSTRYSNAIVPPHLFATERI